MKRLSLKALLFIALSPLLANAAGFQVDIRNAPIADTIRLMAKMQGKNVIIPDKITGRINATFPSIALNDAFAAILSTNELGAIVDGDVVRVMPKKLIETLGQDLITTTFALKYAQADKLVPQVKLLLSQRGTVMSDQRTNSVTVRDIAIGMSSATDFIKQVDQIDRQVLIEARIVQASENYLQQLGVQWGTAVNGGKLSINGVQTLGLSASGRPFNINLPADGTTSGASLTLGGLPAPFNQLFIDAQITAAEAKGDVSILSRPSIVTMNNQTATIHSGAKFYVRTSPSLSLSAGGGGSGGSSSSGGGSSSNANGGLQEIDSGITLAVTPQITADNKINLVINVTQSQPDFSNAVDGIPSIQDNTATTTVLLDNSETTVIGGLFQKSASKQKAGVPGLSRIPILRAIFGSTEETKNKQELLIFLRPTVIAAGTKPAIQDASDKRSKEIIERADKK